MYFVGFFCVLFFLQAQHTDNDVVFGICAVLSAVCAGAIAWYFSDEDREVR